MADSLEQRGPAARLFVHSKRLLQRLLTVAQSRISLVVVELAEEKQLLVKLLLLSAASIVCFSFALMSLLIVLALVIPAEQRFVVLLSFTVCLLVLAALGVWQVLKLSRQESLLSETRRQLRQDLEVLQERFDD